MSLFISGNKFWHLWAKKVIIEYGKIKQSKYQVYHRLKLDERLSSVYPKANRKLFALTRVRKYLDFKKVRILFKEFFEAQFKYCLLTWMFYSRSTNIYMNHLHKRALRSIYGDYELTLRISYEKMDHSRLVITILRRYVLNYTKYTVTCQKLLSATCSHKTVILIIYARNLIFLFCK